MQPVEKIRKLLRELPKSDQQLGEQFLQQRDFESLKELVDSAILRVKKSVKSDSPKQEYVDVDLYSLMGLKAEIDVYVELIEGPKTEEELEYD